VTEFEFVSEPVTSVEEITSNSQIEQTPEHDTKENNGLVPTLESNQITAELLETAANDMLNMGSRDDCVNRFSGRNRIPNKRFFNENFVSYHVKVTNTYKDPDTVEDALNSAEAEQWKRAMDEELQAHMDNLTWIKSDLPEYAQAIVCKWVFKTKFTAKGEIERFKARLVAKGCSQRPGIDFEETFSPVVRYNSIRFLLALAAKLNLDVDQMEVVTAFLNPKLDEEIYIRLPTGIKCNGEICRLQKSIYGLKQASRAWNKDLGMLLKDLGLQQSNYDPCVYFHVENGNILIVAVYVDDLLLFSNNVVEKEQVKIGLMKRFKMKDLGRAHFCLGMRIIHDQDRQSITLDQEKYINEVLERFKMSDCNGALTPLDPNQDLYETLNDENENRVDVPYQELIGCLMYLAQSTRPDIAYSVGVLSRFNNCYSQIHWTAAKRVLRYLKRTLNWKLVFFERSV
jgi:hypothetical protein